MVVPERPLLTRAVHGDGSSSRGDFDVFTFGVWCCSGIRGRRRSHFLLASVLLAAWAKTSEAGYLSGWGLDVTMLAIFWDRVNEVLWLPLRSRRSHSRSWLERPLTWTMYYIWASFVGEFTFADGECDGLLVLTCTVAVGTEVTRIGHRATWDVRWTTEEQALREALHFRPRWGRRRPKQDTSLGWRLDVTVLVIPRDPEHQVLTYVFSGSVVRFRSACCGRPDPYPQDVSAVCTIKEAKW